MAYIVPVMNMATPATRATHYREITGLYTDNGFQRIKRHWAYLGDSSSPVSKTLVATTISGATVAGAIAGKSAGELVVQTYFADSPSDLKDDSLKMRAGRYIGAFFGGASGAAASIYLYIACTEQTDRFSTWRTMKLSHAMTESILLNYGDDAVLTEHTCPVLLAPMKVPARTPTGSYFELEVLLSSIDNNGMIRDVHRNPPFREDQIVVDFERGVIINKRIRHLLMADLAQLGADSPLRSTLLKQLAEVTPFIQTHWTSAKEVIEAKNRAGVLIDDAYFEEQKRFFGKCGATIERDLVWP